MHSLSYQGLATTPTRVDKSQVDSISALIDKLIFAGLIVYLGTFVFDGLLRYLLASIGMENLLYLRDGIYILSILLVSYKSVFLDRRISAGLFLLGLVFIVHLSIGALNGLAPFSQAFGMKVFFTFIYGCVIWPIVARRFQKFLSVLQFFMVAILASVIAQKFFGQMFWENQDYHTAFGSSTTSREWFSGESRRLSGFTRTSFDASAVLALGALAFLHKHRNLLAQLVVSVLVFVAIVWTTTKGMMLAFAVLATWFLIFRAHNRIRIGRLIACGAFGTMIMVPLIVIFYELGDLGKVNNAPLGLTSLWDRFSRMWPNAKELFDTSFHYLSGMGIGAIGTAQNYGYSPHLTNAADNLFVYGFVSFGVMTIAYLGVPLLRSWHARFPQDEQGSWYLGTLIICFVYGLTTNIIEQAILCCALGMVFGMAIQLQKEPAVKAHIEPKSKERTE